MALIQVSEIFKATQIHDKLMKFRWHIYSRICHICLKWMNDIQYTSSIITQPSQNDPNRLTTQLLMFSSFNEESPSINVWNCLNVFWVGMGWNEWSTARDVLLCRAVSRVDSPRSPRRLHAISRRSQHHLGPALDCVVLSINEDCGRDLPFLLLLLMKQINRGLGGLTDW